MDDNSRVVEFPKSRKRKLDRIRKKTPFRFDPLPSHLAEHWLAELNLAELRCLIYICRRTWGFKKEWDAISYQQFSEGIRDRNGKQVDAGVGFKKTHVRDTLLELKEKGLIEIQCRKTRANLYRLTVKPRIAGSDTQTDSAYHSRVIPVGIGLG